MNDISSLAIGIDLGATKIAAALVNERGRVLAASNVLTGAADGPALVLDRIAAQAAALIAKAPAALMGIGIGSPGQVNTQQGTVRGAVNLGWDEVHLADEICARLDQDLRVWIQKDTNASALGEYYFGAAQGITDFVYLSLGSGLGAGVLANNALITGAHSNASELGHLSLDPHGLLCNCGQHGCAETIVSGPGLLRLTRRYLNEGRFQTELAEATLDTTAILTAARRSDALALAALEDVGRSLGVVMSACVAVLDPQRIVIGGGLGLAAFDFLAPAARRELQQRTLPASYIPLEIVPSQLASSAVGAAGLVWYYAKSAQTR